MLKAWDKKIGFIVSAIVFLALSLRLFYIYELYQSGFLNQYHSNSDGYNYLMAAKAMLERLDHNYSLYFVGAKFYVFLLSLCFKSSLGLLLIQILQALFSGLSILYFYLTLKEWESEKAGIIGSLLLAFYNMSVLFTGLVSYTSFFASSFIFFIYKLSLYSKDPTPKKSLHCFLALLLTSLFRREFWPLLFLFPLLSFIQVKIKGKRKLFLPLGMILLSVLAYQSFKPAFPLSQNFGIHFYMGNKEGASGLYEKLPHIRPNSKGHLVDGLLYANSPLVDTKHRKGYFLHEGLSYISENPKEWGRVFIKKVLLFINHFEARNNTSLYYQKQYCRSLQVAFIGFGFILPFALVGIFISSLSQLKRYYLIYLVFGYQLAICLSIFISARYRFHIVPMLLLFSALGIIDYGKMFLTKEWKRGFFYTLLLAGGFYLSHLEYASLSKEKEIKYFENEKLEIEKESKNRAQLLTLFEQREGLSSKKLLLLGRHMKQLNLLEEGVKVYEHLLQKVSEPKAKSIVLGDLANLQEDMMRFQKALETWKQLQEINPNSDLAKTRIQTIENILKHL